MGSQGFCYQENQDWKGFSYDKGIPSLNGEYYSPDAKNFYGDNVAHVTISGKSCVKIKMEAPAPIGEDHPLCCRIIQKSTGIQRSLTLPR